MMEKLVQLVRLLENQGKKISTMESCTGGYLASLITNVEGASDVFSFSAVTYSNEFKIKMGVNSETIDKYSVYSIETAKEMSKSISAFSLSNYGIGITGNLDLTKDNNKVYYSIYCRDNNTYITDIIYPDTTTREKMKDYVCNTIIEKLIKIINS